MTRTILIAGSAAALAWLAVACADRPPPAPIAVCEALRPDMPVKYHADATDVETVGNIRRANARYRAACPEAAR